MVIDVPRRNVRDRVNREGIAAGNASSHPGIVGKTSKERQSGIPNRLEFFDVGIPGP